MFPDFIISISYLNTALAVLLALAALVFHRGKLAWALFAFGMLVVAAESALAAALRDSASVGEMLIWQKFKNMAAALSLPGWLMFSICYSRGNYRESLHRWKWVIALFSAIPILAAFGFSDQLAVVQDQPAAFRKAIVLGTTGRIVYLFRLMGSVLILMNLERTFRSAIGIMRWRIKYVVFGAGLLFGASVYTSSQTLLYSAIHNVSLEIDALALLVAALLFSYSFLRTRFAESEIYPSQQVLQQSVTVVLAGAYLVLIGGLAKIVAYLGGDPSFPLKALLIMLAVICFSVLVLSAKVQQKIKFFVSRHFARPVYDHRKVWAACTERLSLVPDPADLSRAVVTLISDTFEILSVTVWLTDENRRSLTLGASSSLTAEQAADLLARARSVEGLLQLLRGVSAPVDLDTGSGKLVEALRELDPDHFSNGGHRICLPLVAGSEHIGLITLADRVNGRPLGTEDLDLLTCIANQVASAFRNLEMSRTLIQNKEMQAFQAMSAFFVHDLRNSASTLSLMLQNLGKHFGNPDFREDCLRSLSKSVAHVNDLIQRLTLLRHELDLKKGETDLNGLVSSSLMDFAPNGLTIVKELNLAARIPADPDQLRKVITNLLLNAHDATGGNGEIHIRTSQQDKWAVLSVSDSGCGMSPEFLKESLFRPFQTTKKNGMGIGMFHSKTIVEAHRGHIEVESQPGHGTTFRVLLPLLA